MGRRITLIAASLAMSAAVMVPVGATGAEQDPVPTECSQLEKVAHRGYHPSDVDENTPEAIEGAAERGYSVELDVWPDARGVLWVFHDRDVSHATTHRRAFIDQMTTREVRALRYEKAGSPVMRFSAALALLESHPDLRAYVEPKASAVSVAAAIHDSGRIQSTWMTASAFTVHRAYPDIQQLQKIAAGQPPPAIHDLTYKNVTIVALAPRDMTPANVAYYHDGGLEVQGRNSLRTAVWRRTIRAGADGQLTNDPSSLESFCPVALLTPVIGGSRPRGSARSARLVLRGQYFYDVRSVALDGRRVRFTTVSPQRVVARVPAGTPVRTTAEVTNPNGTASAVVRTR